MKKRIRKYLAYSALGAAGLLALSAAGGAWWLWGWRVGSLHFHESWAPEQREALQQEAEYLSHFIQHEDAARAELFSSHAELFNEPYTPLSLWEYVQASITYRPLLAGTMTELRRTAAEGKAPAHDPQVLPMVYLAARLGQLPLAHELVRRGESPQEVYRYELGENTVNESSFQAALACAPFFPGMDSKVPVAERKALLEHMLTCGAQLPPTQECAEYSRALTLHICLLSALQGDGGEMLEWLLEKGFAPDAQEMRLVLPQVLRCPGTLPVLRRLVPKYAEDAEDAELRHMLLLAAVHPAAEENPLPKLRWVLEELHADPNADFEYRDASDDETAPPHTMPSAMDMFCVYLARMESRHLPEMLDLLLTHGGRLEHPEQYMPTEETLRQEYMKVINKHRIPLPTPAEGSGEGE